MKLTRAQKRAKLEEAAGEIIDALLDWDEKNGAPNLTEIEDEVLRLRQRFGQEMAGVVVEGQRTRQLVESPRCPSCGEEMRYKGRKRKEVESRVGGLGVERGYYHCGKCGRGIFPPG